MYKKQISNIEISVSEMSFGWQKIHLIFDDIKIDFLGSYIGVCPLSSLIEIVAEIDSDIECKNLPDKKSVTWSDEPEILELAIRNDEKVNNIEISISYEDSFDQSKITTPLNKYNFIVKHDDLRAAVVKEASRMLRTYGLQGYNRNWVDGTDNFPISAFLQLMGNKSNFYKESDTYSSSLEYEISLLKSIL
jgi:hypothetical protein